jgi:hypothetical protein
LQALLERHGGKIADGTAGQQDGVACGDAARAQKADMRMIAGKSTSRSGSRNMAGTMTQHHTSLRAVLNWFIPPQSRARRLIFFAILR